MGKVNKTKEEIIVVAYGEIQMHELLLGRCI